MTAMKPQARSNMHKWIVTAVGLLALAFVTRQGRGEATPTQPLPAIENASWIWGSMDSDVAEFRVEFELQRPPTAAAVLITADNGYELCVNGALVGYDIGPGAEVWSSVERWDVNDHLKQGRNVLGIRGIAFGGQRGVIAALRVERQDAKPLELVTNASWRVTTSEVEPEEYSLPEYEADEQWVAATALGRMGMSPWGNLK